MRCRMIREDAYEVGLRFFEQIEISTEVAGNSTEALFG
jgi:hypothetical protein